MTGRIWDLISEPARPRFIALLVLVGLGGFVELAGIAATANMMGLVAMAGQGGSEGPLDFILGWAGVEKPISRLQNGLLITVAILAFVHGYSILKSWLRSSFVWQQDQELTTRLFQACLNRPYSWFLQKNSAQLQRILSSGHITQGLINGTLSAAGHLSVALTLTLALVVADFRIAGLSFLAVASAYSLVRLFTQRTLKDKGGQAHRLDTARKTIASEALTNVRFVKAVGRESFFVNRFEEYSHGATTGMVFHSIYVDTVRAFLEWITFSGILVLSVAWVTGQDSLETLLPTLTLYTMAGYRIVPAIHELFGLWSRLKFDESFFSQVKDLLSSGPEVSGPQESIVGLKDSPVLLSLNKVSFTYDGAERQALTDLDLEVRRGQWIGVVGTTGAGKTTLLDVISGLISCQKGEVRVGHSLLNSQVAKDWQSNLGVVPQEVILLDDSLARNVAFGVETTGVDLERVHQVCHMAGLSELLESLPEGLETRLGERGTRLSGGERQRVGLARALYRKPTLLLLDEATSALDQATERRIISTFESLAQECTMVTVAHRLSSVQPCHCILVMKDGQIVERGTYQELLEHSEVFRALALM